MQPLQQFAKTTSVYSREAQGQADGIGQRLEGPDSIISSSDLSSAVTMRIDREQAHCIALWDPLYWTQGQHLVSILQKRPRSMDLA